jgi:hypothetical protein
MWSTGFFIRLIVFWKHYEVRFETEEKYGLYWTDNKHEILLTTCSVHFYYHVYFGRQCGGTVQRTQKYHTDTSCTCNCLWSNYLHELLTRIAVTVDLPGHYMCVVLLRKRNISFGFQAGEYVSVGLRFVSGLPWDSSPCHMMGFGKGCWWLRRIHYNCQFK